MQGLPHNESAFGRLCRFARAVAERIRKIPGAKKLLIRLIAAARLPASGRPCVTDYDREMAGVTCGTSVAFNAPVEVNSG